MTEVYVKRGRATRGTKYHLSKDCHQLVGAAKNRQRACGHNYDQKPYRKIPQAQAVRRGHELCMSCNPDVELDKGFKGGGISELERILREQDQQINE